MKRLDLSLGAVLPVWLAGVAFGVAATALLNIILERV